MLEGSLGDFSLPDIFQLIALTKKTGALTVRSGEREGRVLFSGGEVTFAVSDVHRVALGARLVAAGLVEEGHVTRALERRRDGNGDLLALLLDEAALDEHAVEAFLRAQIEDAVFDLMRLDTASFSFDAGEEKGDDGLTVSTEHLVAEGSRRLGEWSTIRGHIPSADAVLELSPDPAVDGDTVAVGVAEWRLLALVDGRRTVRDIVELTGKGEFATSKHLAEFLKRGFLQVAATHREEGGALAGMVARRDMLRRLEALELGQPVPRPEPEQAAAAASARKPQVDGAWPSARHSSVVPEAPAPNGAAARDEPAAEDDLGPRAPEPLPPPLMSTPSGEPDRAQAAREFASLGLDDVLPPAPSPPEVGDPPKDDDGSAAERVQEPAGRNGAEQPETAARHLTRDEDVNKGLLLRLIDGVKGA